MALSVRLKPKRPCFICGRREGDLTVSIWDQLRDVCEPCYERGTEAARSEHEEPPETDYESDPTRNGAFR